MLARVRVQQLIVRLRMGLMTDPRSILFQVKYTNRSSSNTTRTVFVANQRQALQCMHFDLVLLDFLQKGEDTEIV